jgi:hypothetical protein
VAGAPMDAKLALIDAVADPVKPHIDGFGSTLFDYVVDDTCGT